MGAKTWMVVYSNGDVPSIWNRETKLRSDRNAEILKTLFPGEKYNDIENGCLAYTNPRGGEVQIADLGELIVVATDKVALDNPSKIPRRFVTYPNYKYTYLFAMHSVVDWFAFAIWESGKLTRSLSLSPDSGIIEDIGKHLSFEENHWNSKHSGDDLEENGTDVLPFHPLDFGEDALLNLMGYQYEGMESLNKVDPENIAMHCYRKKSWWKF